MKLDRMILREVVPMWFFGTTLFTVLVLAGSFLPTLTQLIADGANFGQVMVLALETLPIYLGQSMPMGMLLGTLLAFGRLSGDSEVVAIRAAGVSIERIMVSVAVFGALVTCLSFLIEEVVVPWTKIDLAKRNDLIQKVVAHNVGNVLTRPILDSRGKLSGYIEASDLDLSSGRLRGVVVVTLGNDMKPSQVMSADEMVYVDNTKWKVVGDSLVYDLKDKSTVEFHDGAWPKGVTEFTEDSKDLISRTMHDKDVLSIPEIRAEIQRLRVESKVSPALAKLDEPTIRDYQFHLWNRFAIPLMGLCFGLLGAPLGIRNHRTGAATGFALSIAIIFGYFLLANSMNAFNMSGAIPAWVASFTPVAAGLVAAAILIHKRNVQ